MSTSAMDLATDAAAKILIGPTSYPDDERLHTVDAHLRAHRPVAWVDNPPYRPFWVFTKQADITAAGRDNELLVSGCGTT